MYTIFSPVFLLSRISVMVRFWRFFSAAGAALPVSCTMAVPPSPTHNGPPSDISCVVWRAGGWLVKPGEACPVPDIDWIALGLLVASVLLAVLYGLAVSGHFPAHLRSATLRRGWGVLLLWGTMAATGLAAGAAALCAWR